MENKEFILYTYMHRRAFKYVVQTMVDDEGEKKALLERAKYHDLDKQLLYFLIDKKAASEYHRGHSSHHMGNNPCKEEVDIMEAVVDYECAGYTKADKPRNAYQTIIELKPKHYDELIHVTEKWGINWIYYHKPDDAGWEEYNESMPEPMLEDAIAEVIEYVLAKPEEAKELLSFAKHYKENAQLLEDNRKDNT